MSGLDDINFAISLINPNQNKDLIILQCTTEYPCPPEDINLAVLPTLEKEFKCKVGFSDHSNSIEIPALAVPLALCDRKTLPKQITTRPRSQRELEPKPI